MNADRLLALYERIADAPDAVARLRRFILDLAVRGKLVPQDPADEPASELLKRIAAEKARLVTVGDLKQQALQPPAPTAFSFVLPPSWAVAPLAMVTACLDYRRVPVNTTEREKRTDGKDPRDLVPYYGATQQKGWIDDFLFDEELVLLGEDGVPFFEPLRPKAYLVSGKSWVNNHAHVFRPIMVRGIYLVHFLNVFDYAGRVTGATRPKLNQARAIDIPVPLPPRAEQERIVAKVDELMELCDRLEEARARREADRDRLTTASLSRLSAPDTDAQTFQSHARFALDGLPALTTRPDQIKALRQTILNLAVRGKLLTGGTGAVHKIRSFRSLQNGYAFKSEWFKKEGIKLLRNANVGHGSLRWEDVVYLSPEKVAEFDRFLLKEGDVVLTLDRPFIVTGTKVARVCADDLPSLLLQRVARFVETVPGLDDDYLFLWIISPHFSEQIDPGRSNGVPHISSKQVEAAELFVPPLPEQHRIVAKVDQLMALCDQLEAALTAADTTRRRLLEALLHEALDPAAGALEAAQ